MKQKNEATEAAPRVQCKDTAFSSTPATMMQVSRSTGIDRANICRYISHMKEEGEIRKVRLGYCPITGWRAGFYTTDEKLWPKQPHQLELFDKEQEQPRRMDAVMNQAAKASTDPRTGEVSLMWLIEQKGGQE